MKKIIFILFLSVSTIANAQNADTSIIKSLYAEALSDETAYKNLEFLCTKIGGRLCGSPQAAAGLEWAKQVMNSIGMDTVYTQKIFVHHWDRGEKEKASIASKVFGSKDVNICALGESVGTPMEGVNAEVIEVFSLEQLKKLGKKQITGKIVFFNKPMNPEYYNTFEAYGDVADIRFNGASEAAKYGAVGMIIRSLTLLTDDYPHTGIMDYDTSITKIPAVAISTRDADVLSSWLKTDYELIFHFKTNCKFYPETESYNLIGEIKGSEKPDEIITIGGHIDSWDLGQGAHDDGVGCVQTLEVARLFRDLQIKPKHTIRFVMFMDEECAQRGGRKYAVLAKEKNEKHIAAIESDAGGFTPVGFEMKTSIDTVNIIAKWKDLFLPYGIYQFEKGWGGVDIGFMINRGIPLIELMTDSQRYFDYQHAGNDTFDKVNKREMQLGSASIAALTYLIDKYGFVK
ncbi:MAG TPA: M20/M25/M40 family metallo-hydrolase [Bacteroidales bacterium]|nr:M20/M25/M40 family metallo-hydrolase [Bacteroidales bacterium]HPS17202.1 M20/M25/M40 family metallo-hydrolase [Bacteroidales bacterium]